MMNYERARLTAAGKENLIERIEQVSITEGDGAGYDIHSYEVNGKDRFIEAKTTKYGKETPFFISSNELRFSNKYRDYYFLYRVFKFRDSPRLFALKGYLEENCEVSPIQYIARP